MGNIKSKQLIKNVCPRNCHSSCTMLSHVENNYLIHLRPNPKHPYTKGKLCSKGYTYKERIYHPQRLKFPYYQEVKGSGKFKQISWEKAYNLILGEMLSIYDVYEDFTPIELYKGSGNIGVHHHVTEQFFNSLHEPSRLAPLPKQNLKADSSPSHLNVAGTAEPSTIRKASMLVIWGANPAATNIHLIPFIIHAKLKGAKLVVIDPIYTETAKLADLYIQLRPGTDGALANVLIKRLVKMGSLNLEFIKFRTTGFHEYFNNLEIMDENGYVRKCGIPDDAVDTLLKLFVEADAVSHIIGKGIQKHWNGSQNVRAIESLALVRGDIEKMGGGVFIGEQNEAIFNNQFFTNSNNLSIENRIHNMNEQLEDIPLTTTLPPIEMLWISCANPLTQAPSTELLTQGINRIPFVVTVEQFLTPTALMSNLVLPTTSHFEELDIIFNPWHKGLALNEIAITPYFESRSEWNIINELAVRLQQHLPNMFSFPTYSTEEDYLNAQFNAGISELYGVENVSDLRNHDSFVMPLGNTQESTGSADSRRYLFYCNDALQEDNLSLSLLLEKSPTERHPFWLITPHHPYTHNSQFQFLDLNDEKEAFVSINEEVAKNKGFFNREIIKVFNDWGSIEIKAIYSNQVPKDVIFIYEGWYPDSGVSVNTLIPHSSNLKSIPYYDTFVNVCKL